MDISVVGLGQAGGNIAAELCRRGYRVTVFNTAHTDLDALDPGGLYPTVPPERRVYIGLDGYDGAGGDASYGRECIQEHSARIRTAILKQASDSDAVIIAAGLGGGTGSAVSELVEILKNDDLPLVVLMTLPTEAESGIAKVNTVRAINEIVDAKLFGWIFIDNARIASLNPNVPIVEYYAHINKQITAPIDEFNRLNARDNHATIRSFDGEDFRKLFLSGGVLNYAVVELPSISTEEVVGTVRDAIEASDLMPGGFDFTRLSYLGLVVEAPEKALAETPISVFEEIDEQLKSQTEGAAVYHGIYRTDGEPTTLRLIAATQSLPHRVRQVLSDAKREGTILTEKIKEEIPPLELGEIDQLELFRTRTSPSQRPRKVMRAAVEAPPTRDEIPLQVAGPPPREEVDEEPTPVPEEASRKRSRRSRRREGARRPRASESIVVKHPPPSKKKKKKEQRSTPAEIGTEEIDLRKLTKEEHRRMMDDDATISADEEDDTSFMAPGEDTGNLPSPELYDNLVANYLSAKTERVRKEVAVRLEHDSNSDDTAVRYYAVEAMAKLGTDIFGQQLLTATEDDNEAVRTLAEEALSE